MGGIQFDIPGWIVLTFAVCAVAWPLILAAGGTAIVSLIAATATKSAIALKVAAVAAAVFFSPLVIGIVGAPIFMGEGGNYVDLAHQEWKEDTPLIRAVKIQDYKKVEKLLKKGADPNAFSEDVRRTPLSESCKAYDKELKADRITALLLNAGADPNKKIEFENDAMKNAVVSKRQDAIRLLCSHGYAFLTEDGNGNGIAEFAMMEGCYAEACLLLELGAIPCGRYDFGFCKRDYTPFLYIMQERIFPSPDLDETAEHKKKRLSLEKKKIADLCRLFKILLEKGLDVNALTPDHRKDSALILLADYSAPMKKMPLAKMLLDAGADVNIQNADGKTALMFLAKIPWSYDELSNREKWIRLFVSYGADKTLRDEEGLTALDYFHHSCRKEKLKETELPLYDEIERLLTPDTESKSVTGSKASVTERGNSVNETESSEKVQIAIHLPLEDMSDDW